MDTSNIESIIIKVLRVGVVISASIILIGLILLFSTGDYYFDINNISFTMVISQAINLRPAYIIMIGLLVLILTPVIRIVASLIIFKVQDDKTYVCITLIVLIILAISFFIGFTV